MRSILPARTTRRTTAARAGALALVVLVMTGACDGGDDDDDASGTTTTEETATTSAPTTTEAPTTTLSPEDEVLTAYRAAGAAITAAFDPPNPTHPDLLAHLSGDVLARVQSRVGQMQGQGVSVVSTLEAHPVLKTIAGDTAVVEDCFRIQEQLVDTASRAPVGQPGDPVVVHIESQLERIDGTWKIVREQELSASCTPG